MSPPAVKIKEEKVFAIAEYNIDSWIKLRQFYFKLKNIFGADKRIIIMRKNNWQELCFALDESIFTSCVDIIEYKEEIPDKKDITGISNNFIFDL
jgi:hypothetical protein